MTGKNNFPGFKAVGGTGRKIVGLAFLAALMVIVVKYPSEAAGTARALAAAAEATIDGIATFLRQLF